MEEYKIKPEENEGHFEVNTIKWVENKLMNFVNFFRFFDEAVEHCKKDNGKMKIYDHKRRIVFSCETSEESYA